MVKGWEKVQNKCKYKENKTKRQKIEEKGEGNTEKAQFCTFDIKLVYIGTCHLGSPLAKVFFLMSEIFF